MNAEELASCVGTITNHKVPLKKDKQKLEPPKHLISISEIRPHLYLSGYGCITDSKLKSLGITHAVDCTNLHNSKRFHDIEYLEVPLEDTNIANAAQYFQTVADFIESAKSKGGKCLVFCAAGVSRSASFVLMYLVLKEGLALRDAYYDVNEKRPIISPNMGFWQQMVDFERSTKDEATVTIIRGRMARPVPDVYLKRKPTALQD